MPVPTFVSFLSYRLTVVMRWSPILGLSDSPVNVVSTTLAITWMRIDLASARVETRAMQSTTSVKRHVMRVPPHRKVFPVRRVPARLHHTPNDPCCFKIVGHDDV
jgi:hypothetical protein